MLPIYQKELKQLFISMMAYVFLAVFFVIGGMAFVSSNLLVQSGDIKQFFSALSNQVIFIIPLLTMRSFSEEKKMRTDQLLMTLPLRDSAIVLGKFFSALTFFFLGMLLNSFFPLYLARMGAFEPLVILGNCVGMLFLAACLIAVGLFISALTENQIISAILSYSLFTALWVLSYFYPFVSDSRVKSLLQTLSLSYHFTPFTYGIFDVGSILFYGFTTALFLCFTGFALRYRRTFQ